MKKNKRGRPSLDKGESQRVTTRYPVGLMKKIIKRCMRDKKIPSDWFREAAIEKLENDK